MHRTMKILVFGLLALTVIAFRAPAQNDQAINNELRKLREELRRVSDNQDALAVENNRLAADNAELKRRLDAGEIAPSDLETAINALSASAEFAAGTTVNSIANPITLTGSFRTRGGFTANRDFGAGTGNGADDNGTFVDARVTIGFNYELSRNVTAFFQLDAAGLWDNGDTDPSTGRLATVNMYQGWVLIDKLFGRDEIGSRFGRQEIVLGDEFHFGNNEFYGGENFDAALIWWGQKEFSLTAILAKMAVDNNYTPRGNPYNGYLTGSGHDDDEFYALYFTYKNIENHVIDLYWVYFRGEFGGSVGTLGSALSDGDSDVHAIGFRLAGTFDVAAGLDYKVEFTYETGDLDNLGLSIDNFGVEAGFGITLNKENKFRIFVRGLYAEGPDGKDIGFVSPFPDRHNNVNWDDHTAIQARYGLMDIIPMSNVITGQIGFTVNPNDSWQFGATFLAAWHDQDVLTTAAVMDDGIGYEIDVFAHYRHSDETTITFGVGVFLPEDGAPHEGGMFAGGNEDDPAFLVFIQSLTNF